MKIIPQTKSLSIIIPVYNSAEILPELVRQLQEQLPVIAAKYEIILVNDGSADESWAVISRLSASRTHVHGINMMRNYGQHNALLCGIRAAGHEVIITMDDDLQHPPAEIHKLLEKLAEGYDVVYGSPQRAYQNWWRELFSNVIRKLLTWVMGVETFRKISAFRAVNTGLRNSFSDYNNPDVLLDVLLSWGTTRFASVPVRLAPRAKGASNYTLARLFNTALLVLTAFSTAPLRIASFVGFAFMAFGILVFIYVIYVYLFLGSIPGFSFLASIIALFSGAQLFSLGILGEYQAKMFLRSMHRPPYVVREVTDRQMERGEGH